jgi:hypothetical protein
MPDNPYIDCDQKVPRALAARGEMIQDMSA